MIYTLNVAEAFQRGVHIAKGADDVEERFATVLNPDPGRGAVWQLGVSEWNEMLDTLRGLFQFLAPHPRIENAEVRHIASQWHGGQSSPLYALSSSGAIVSGVVREIDDCLKDSERIEIYSMWAERDGDDLKAQAHDQAMLRRLRSYVRWHGLRGPQPFWSNLG